MAQTHKSMIYQAGFERGMNVASWIETPEIGQRIPKHIDYIGIGTIEDAEDAQDAFVMLAQDAESNGRDYSPFEFIARELNNLQAGMHQESFAYSAEIVPFPENGQALDAKTYDVWDEFDRGIEDGIYAEWRERE